MYDVVLIMLESSLFNFKTIMSLCLVVNFLQAWFRELPTGILDSLAPDEVMGCQNEEECAQLVRRLPPTEAALLDWALNLMADVVQMDYLNKMNAHNIAMVFAPNMTQVCSTVTFCFLVVLRRSYCGR